MKRMKLQISILLGCMLIGGIGVSSCNQQAANSYDTSRDTLSADKKAEIKFYESGQRTFKIHCSSCHAMDKQLVGPPLAESTSKYSMEWIIEFTRNPMMMIKEKKDSMAIEVYNQYKQTEMPRFNNFTDSMIMAIFYYADSPRRNQPQTGVPVN